MPLATVGSLLVNFFLVLNKALQLFFTIYGEFWSCFIKNVDVIRRSFPYSLPNLSKSVYATFPSVGRETFCNPINAILLLLHCVCSHLTLSKRGEHNWSCVLPVLSVFLCHSNHPSFHLVRIYELYSIWYIGTPICSIRMLRFSVIQLQYFHDFCSFPIPLFTSRLCWSWCSS